MPIEKMITQLKTQSHKIIKLRELEQKIASAHMQQLTEDERVFANDTENPIGFLQCVYSSVYSIIQQQSDINEDIDVIDFSKFTESRKLEETSSDFCHFSKSGLYIDEKTEVIYISGNCLKQTYKNCICQSEQPELTLKLWNIGVNAFNECDNQTELLNNNYDIIAL